MAWRTCVFLLYVTAVLADGDWLEVEIEQGPVRGRKHRGGDLYTFYNIPYATGPSGEDRFKPPLPPPTWTEPFNATAEKIIICPQNSLIFGLFPNILDVKEDCLVANVFVPVTTEKDLSVFVYVHGGGFSTGFGNLYQGTQFVGAKKDFIMVTFNYRLGVHGFLCLGTEDVPGNAGMKDQVELLRWVQKNIASFGGNPNDVTLVGSSAGSASVELIMLSKSAENLFHRVIPESAGSLSAFTVQRDPLDNAKTFAKKLNELASVDEINSLEQFYKTASIDALTAEPFDDRTDSSLLFSSCVERNTNGAFLTESPLSILKKADLLVESGHNQVYLYEYVFVDKYTPVVPHTDDVRGADHCAQSFAWMDPLISWFPQTPEYRKMRATVREIWHNFMKTGKPVPVGSSLPEWPALGVAGSPHMVLNETLQLYGALLPERKRLWEGIYEKHYRDSIPPGNDV
ncbi:hypothetical protein PYW07_004065 [Mythimna separata]|uniref:Carboxylic ester hydrolase n=1 Tax=Mythimna separata TaxID=271217 RepID=A0AAD7YPH9_MYTSE|nr:hypothetical protein PYW07_004065 [Mythimna separata]